MYGTVLPQRWALDLMADKSAVNVIRFFFSSRRRHTRLQGDWSSDVCCLPFESRSAPRIGARDLAVAQRPEEVDHGHHIADGQDAGAGGGENVEHLKLRRIQVVAPCIPR